jgi:hypothetical protein
VLLKDRASCDATHVYACTRINLVGEMTASSYRGARYVQKKPLDPLTAFRTEGYEGWYAAWLFSSRIPLRIPGTFSLPVATKHTLKRTIVVHHAIVHPEQGTPHAKNSCLYICAHQQPAEH